MPPIDPLQLLTALSPLLGIDGGMKSKDEVPKLASLMKKFSKKLVSRCVYVQILKATDPIIMQEFLNHHGWEIVNTWLQEGKDKEDYGFLTELLQLYVKLPMTVDKLKENNSARIIKALGKVENDSVKKLAHDIVNAWMKLVKREKQDSISEEKGVRKKKKHHHDSAQHDKPNHKKKKVANADVEEGALKAPSNQVVPTRKGTVKIKKVVAEKKVDKLAKSLKRTNVEELEDVKPVEIVAEKPIKKQKKEQDRPSTVKTFRASFRATGLEEAPSLEKPVVKKIKLAEKSVPPLTIKRPMIAISDLNSSSEKKVRLETVVSPTTDSCKIPTASKPKPVHHVLHDSAGFMDALVTPARPVRKKKKVVATAKGSSNDAILSPTITVSSPSGVTVAESKPQFQFYKDTLESPKDKTPDTSIEMTKEGERTPTPPLNVEEQDDKENKGSDQDVASESASSETNDATTKDSKPFSNLKQPGTSKKKKSVRWSEEAKLTETFYFDLDETERVNVNLLRNFGDMKNMDLQMEKKTMMNARRIRSDDHMEEQIQWYMPHPLDVKVDIDERGKNSTEREAQNKRHESVLQYIYLNRESIIDSPLEPDPDSNTSIQSSETKIIPLEDESMLGTVIDYSKMSPIPSDIMNTDLPPALTNLMMSMNANVNNNETMIRPVKKASPMRLDDIRPMMQQFNNFNNFNSQMVRGSMNSGQIMQDNMQRQMRMRGQVMMGSGREMMAPRSLMMGPPLMGANNMRPGQQNIGPSWRGQRGQARGGRGFMPRVPCRNFKEGTCQFGNNCRFLHPGFNGPPL